MLLLCMYYYIQGKFHLMHSRKLVFPRHFLMILPLLYIPPFILSYQHFLNILQFKLLPSLSLLLLLLLISTTTLVPRQPLLRILFLHLLVNVVFVIPLNLLLNVVFNGKVVSTIETPSVFNNLIVVQAICGLYWVRFGDNLGLGSQVVVISTDIIYKEHID